jgi:hypothetical protein
MAIGFLVEQAPASSFSLLWSAAILRRFGCVDVGQVS